MWYGKNAPAPASKVHPSYQRPGCNSKLPALKFSWAPLEEPSRRRREEWKIQQRVERLCTPPGGKRHVEGTRARLQHTTSLPDLGSGPTRASSIVQRAGLFTQPQASVQLSGLSRPSSRGEAAVQLSGLSRATSRGEDMSTPGGEKAKRRVSVSAPDGDEGKAPSSLCSSASFEARGEEPKPTLQDEDKNTKSYMRRNSLAGKLLQAKLVNACSLSKELLMAGRTFDVRHDLEQRGTFEYAEKAPIRERAEAVWAVQSKNNEISVGRELAEAFLMMEIPYPVEESLQVIMRRQCQGRESLDKDDFCRIIIQYEDTVKGKLELMFKEAAGMDGMVPYKRVPDLLDEVGVPLMCGVKPEILEQLEAQQKSKVNFVEFVNLYEDTYSRAGLTVAEHTRLSEAFESLEDTDGTVSMEELENILSWNDSLVGLGGESTLQSLVEQTARRAMEGRISIDLESWSKGLKAAQSGEKQPPLPRNPRITGCAVLAAARVLHDRIAIGLKGVMAKVGSRGRALSKEKTLSIIEEVGYFGATVDSLQHFMQVCKYDDGKPLDFDQVYTLIFRYCNADGFTDLEEADLTALFKRFDDDCSGTLECGELGPIIRWLGYQPTQYRVYSFAEDFGLHEESQIDLIQFRRMVANYLKLSLTRVREAFANGCLSGAESESGIKVGDIGQLLSMVGYESTLNEMETMIQSLGGPHQALDFMTFKKLEINHRKHVRKTMEENGGVTNAEYKKYQSYFHDNQNDGFVAQKAMRALLGKLFPCTSLDRTRHVRIAQLVKEADADGNGLFDFKEFVWLMNRVTEDMDRDGLVKGLQLKKRLGYTSAEVKQFKDLYSICDEDLSGYIDCEELCSLLSSLIPVEREAKRELEQRFREADSYNSGELDFWEFLTFMRAVQTDNWRNINGVVGKKI